MHATIMGSRPFKFHKCGEKINTEGYHIFSNIWIFEFENFLIMEISSITSPTNFLQYRSVLHELLVVWCPLA